MLNILKTIILLIFLVTPFSVSAIFEQEIDSKYYSFYNKIEVKYENNKDILTFLYKIDKAILKIKNNTSLSFYKIKDIERLEYLNTNKINRLESFNKVENWIINSKDVFLNTLKSNWFKYIPVNTDNFEFIYNNKINKVFFKKYHIINKDNYQYFIDNFNDWLIINWDNNIFYFLSDYSLEVKIEFSDSINNWFIYAEWKKYPMYIEDRVYKKVNYSTFYDLKDEKYGFYKSDFSKMWEKLVIYNKDNKYWIISNFETSDVLNTSFIKDIKNKEWFLNLLIDDEKYIDISDKNILLYKLKLKTVSLIKWKTDDEKIKIIYNYILNELEYFEGNYTNNKEVFSWLLSYKNWYSVCDWYVKLFWYMLYFSWIENFEIKKWFVINSSDFPEIWHAWLEIKWNYFDPTFDDPIWINVNKIFTEYKYFNLPYDLMYSSRFDWFNIPEKYLWKSEDYLSKIVNSNYVNLLDKYSSYKILEYFNVIKKLKLNVDNISIEDLLENNQNYTVSEKTYSYIWDSWESIVIKWFNYYTFTTNNELNNLIKQLWLTFLNMKIFKWVTISWNIEYRLWYNIKYK